MRLVEVEGQTSMKTEGRTTMRISTREGAHDTLTFSFRYDRGQAFSESIDLLEVMSWAPCGQPYNLNLKTALEAVRSPAGEASISLDDAMVRIEVTSRACRP